MRQVDTILWRRLDVVGHDACRLVQRDGAGRLEEAQHSVGPACLAYEVDCDGEWRTRRGIVNGWMGDRRLEIRVARTHDGIWTLNGEVVAGLEGCVDLDLGFTPATNLTQLRRAALRVGLGVDVLVAWLDLPAGTLDKLHQRYERRTAETYWYEAPRFDYFAMLKVNNVCFVEAYPNFWMAETARG